MDYFKGYERLAQNRCKSTTLLRAIQTKHLAKANLFL